MIEQRFGGTWTQRKLDVIQDYLPAYARIFAKNERAQFLKTVYVDAFAGTGYITPPSHQDENLSLLAELQEPEVQKVLKGSAQIALDMEPWKFDHYVFIEKEPDYAKELHLLKNQHINAGISIQIERADANVFLPQWCLEQDWKKTRAVIFLDPFSVELEWSTLEAISQGKVDVWFLWPIGQAVNRMLTKKALPPLSWQRRLDTIFGTREWIERFYAPDQPKQLGLFGEKEAAPVKVAGFQQIGEFFLERLGTIFTYVAPQPLYLTNSRNNPLYLLCFATHNLTGLKIANDLLTR